MILFINACVRAESRTKRLADYLLSLKNDQVEEIRLDNYNFPVFNEAFLEEREKLIEDRNFENGMFDLARQFSEADEILIAAPLWDLSFPAALKQYIEQINVIGITFGYTAKGEMTGLCKAKRLYYVTTAGGDTFPLTFGFEYIKALARDFYGIHDVRLISAAGLDVEGADVEKILKECEDKMAV